MRLAAQKTGAQFFRNLPKRSDDYANSQPQEHFNLPQRRMQAFARFIERLFQIVVSSHNRNPWWLLSNV